MSVADALALLFVSLCVGAFGVVIVLAFMEIYQFMRDL